MNPKHMRVLVADASQTQRLSVEKFLNQVGCFGVAVVGTAGDLTNLIDYPGRPFDLILVSCHLLDQLSVDAMQALQSRSNVVLYRHGFFSGRIADPMAHISEGLCGLPAERPTLH